MVEMGHSSEGLIMHKCSGRDICHSNAFMVVTGKKTDFVTENITLLNHSVFPDIIKLYE